MSFGSKPQVTTQDPWKAMPGWAQQYYRDMTESARASDARANDIRSQMMGTGSTAPGAPGAAPSGAPGTAPAQSSTPAGSGTRMGIVLAPGDGRDGGTSHRLAFGPVRSSTPASAPTTAFGTNVGDVAGGGSAADNLIAPFLGMAGLEATTGDFLEYLERAGITADEALEIMRGAAGTGIADNRDAEGRIAALQDATDPILGVLDPVLSRMREDEARARAGAEGSAAAVGGSGNTRLAVELARIGSEGTRDRAQFESQLRSDALRNTQDFGLRAEDVRSGLRDRSFGMSGAVADAAAGRADFDARLATARLGIGAFEQDVLEKARQVEQQRREAPMTIESWFRSLTSGAPQVSLPNATTQTTTGGGPSTGSQLLGAATSLAGAIFSDERVKDDIEAMDGDRALEIIRAQRPSVYQYVDPQLDRVPVPGRRSAGLMAQDLEGIPGAVVENDRGVKMVDPYPVMATIAAALQRLDQKVEGLQYG